MTDDDKRAFWELLKKTGRHFHKKKEEIYALAPMYWKILKGFELQDIEKAISRHMANPTDGKWMPKPANIVENLMKSSSVRASQMYGMAVQVAKDYGPYPSVKFIDLPTNESIYQAGGWEEFCQGKVEVERFKELYKQNKKKPKEALSTYVQGKAEIYNKANGHKTAQPLVIEIPKCYQ